MSSKEIRNKVKKYIDEADDHVVKMIYSMLEADRKEDWWDDLPKNVQVSIDKAIKELDAGKGIPHEVVMKKYQKWFTR
jgi:uncharacterized coiled-coil DUF342 family protein